MEEFPFWKCACVTSEQLCYYPQENTVIQIHQQQVKKFCPTSGNSSNSLPKTLAFTAIVTEKAISLPFKANFPSVERISRVFASLQNPPPGNITESLLQFKTLNSQQLHCCCSLRKPEIQMSEAIFTCFSSTVYHKFLPKQLRDLGEKISTPDTQLSKRARTTSFSFSTYQNN